MVAALGIFGMIFVFYAFAFGVTRLLLRGSAWEEYSWEAPLLSGPALIVVALTLFGYRLPVQVAPWQAWSLLGGGTVISAVVLLWDRRQMIALLRTHWPRLATVQSAACLAVLVLLIYFPGNEWDQFFVFENGEYLRYAEMAALLTGQHLGPPGQAWYCWADLREWRDGQDLVVAVVAGLTRLHPARTMLPLAVLFRFQHSAALGLLVCGLAGNARKYWLALLVLVLDAALIVETMAFGLAFFSSNCAAGLYVVYLVLLATQPRFGAREIAILVIFNLFFLMTYPNGSSSSRVWKRWASWRPC